MKKILLPLFLLLSSSAFAFVDVDSLPGNPQNAWEEDLEKENHNYSDIVIKNVQIELENFPYAFNPSLLKADEGLILAFRYCPDIEKDYISSIGIVLLDDDLAPVGKPQILDIPHPDSSIPPHQEDPRLIRWNRKIYLVYNDCLANVKSHLTDRRDMFFVELILSDGKFFLGEPVKLVYEEKYDTQVCQKNWVPFVYDDHLLFAYSMTPHEILFPDTKNGKCSPIYSTQANTGWQWGQLRGGTQAELWDGEYLSFFHSSKKEATAASKGKLIKHYFVGAYTFSAKPPFSITKLTPAPIVGKIYYSADKIGQRVVFPGGMVIRENDILLAYGRNDREIWISTIDKHKLKRYMKPVE